MHQVGAIAKLGATVLATFGAVWAPWLTSSDAVLGVLHRLFPTQRGLYEDYVANFWCVSSRAIKWTRLLSQGQLVRLCSMATLAAAAPAMAMQVRRPSPRGLLLCLANCAFSFFLFSYQVSRCMHSRTSLQPACSFWFCCGHSAVASLPLPCLQVHEKSILLPLLPLTMLLGLEDTPLLNWVNLIATFSMAPLLIKDGLGLASISAVAVCHAANQLATMTLVANSQQSTTRSLPLCMALRKRVYQASVAGCAAILAGTAVVPAPLHLPFLHDALIVTWSFLHVVALLVWTYILQVQEYRSNEVKVKQQ
jgi:alpha-1,3-glucosyltransferase